MATLKVEAIRKMKDMMGITLTVTVGQLGPMPDDEGSAVKKILAEDDHIAIMALGCYLDECRSDGSYVRLTEGIASIRKHQAAKDSSGQN